MLPSQHQQQYQHLKQSLEKIPHVVSNGSDLKLAIAEVQQFFQRQILSLDTNHLDPTDEHRVQSLQVEINKQLRLLELDAKFLQAAKQAVTAGQRQNQVNDRLKTLIRYCEAVLQEESE